MSSKDVSKTYIGQLDMGFDSEDEGFDESSISGLHSELTGKTEKIDIFSMMKERRRSERYDIELVVVVYSKNSFVRLKCQNLSTGGLKLNQRLPAHFAHEKLEIIVMENETQSLNSYFAFHGRAIGTGEGLGRIEFTSVSEKSDEPFMKFINRLGRDSARAA